MDPHHCASVDRIKCLLEVDEAEYSSQVIPLYLFNQSPQCQDLRHGSSPFSEAVLILPQVRVDGMPYPV